MVKMFEDLPMKDLVASMAELLATFCPPEGTPNLHATPTTRGNVSVSTLNMLAVMQAQ
jgi:hypothetical protein